MDMTQADHTGCGMYNLWGKVLKRDCMHFNSLLLQLMR